MDVEYVHYIASNQVTILGIYQVVVKWNYSKMEDVGFLQF